MSNKKFSIILMALVAMSLFKPLSLFAQTKSPSPSYKIKTPNTKTQLVEDKSPPAEEASEEAESRDEAAPQQSSGTPRRLHQHGLGLGLGQTFLLGNYAKYGEDKITMDILYSYAASYSFDLLVNAHMSEHKDNNERMKVMVGSPGTELEFAL